MARLAYKIDCVCNLRFSFFENEKLNWAVLNKMGILACANCESLDQSAA